MTKRLIFLFIILLAPVLSQANESELSNLRRQEASSCLLFNYRLLDVEMFTKNVWSIIDSSKKENYPLFYPHNKVSLIKEDAYPGDYTDANFYTLGEINTYHLWNIILMNFLTGDLITALPVNPDWQIDEDKGFLTFRLSAAIYGQVAHGNYFTDSVYRDFIHSFGVLGYEDFNAYPIALQSVEYAGEDSIDFNGDVVYYPNEFIWYEDKNIIAYEIKESWELDKKARVVKKHIDAIAPIVNVYNGSGDIVGQKLLLWVDYNTLEPFLKEHYVVSEGIITEKKGNSKKEKNIVSLAEYFEQRKFVADVIDEDSLHVKLSTKDTLKNN